MKPDTAAYGTINTQNLNPASGVPTPGSFVPINLGGMSTLSIQTASNSLNQPLSLQVSNDNQNWITLGGTAFLNANTGASSANIPAGVNAMYQLDISAFLYGRLTQLTAASTGSAAVSMNATATDGMVGLDAPIPAGANTIGTVNATTTPATPTSSTLTSAATTNATLVKSTAGNLFEISADNFNAAARFLKLYNKATAPTVGTDVPVLTIPLPVAGSAPVTINFGSQGKRFTTGIGYAITGAQAVSDTTVIAAGDVHVGISYL